MKPNRLSVVYKITWDNGKIYVGQDPDNDVMAYGTPDLTRLEADYPTMKARMKMSICREILWASETATPSELNDRENHFIKLFQSNNPAIGYNRRPKFRPTSTPASLPDK